MRPGDLISMGYIRLDGSIIDTFAHPPRIRCYEHVRKTMTGNFTVGAENPILQANGHRLSITRALVLQILNADVTGEDLVQVLIGVTPWWCYVRVRDAEGISYHMASELEPYNFCRQLYITRYPRIPQETVASQGL